VTCGEKIPKKNGKTVFKPLLKVDFEFLRKIMNATGLRILFSTKKSTQ
jgi:hypothetical protein